MKIINLLLLAFLAIPLTAQNNNEKEITTNVNDVTVFLEGAQVSRKKNVTVDHGISILKFTNLSPFIDAKSVQVKAEGNITVLSVNHQQNFLNELQKSSELESFENKMSEINRKLETENTYLSIIREQIAFLQENRDIGGKNQQVNVSNLQQAAEFYGKKLTELKLSEVERVRTIEKLVEEKTKIENQINTISSKKEYPNGEILVKIDAKQKTSFPIELSYLVANAGWFPSYDIRAKNINEPINLVYKANVKQDTKVDWKNVKLKFSSANPNTSGMAPKLKTYYLGYNTLPPSYNLANNAVSGKVVDRDGNPLPGTSVMVKGTTIGTVTDFDGYYSITIPNEESRLSFSFVGFETQDIQANGGTINVMLNEDVSALDEVVVVGYGKSDKNISRALAGKVAGLSVGAKKKNESIPVPSVQKENQTTIDFEIEMPYTINSDNKNYVVEMTTYELPAQYQYYAVPKIQKDAFLIANINNWEQYNLLEGEANIFFEGTYIGKSLMDVRYITDTLEISLGIDKKVSVNRQKIQDFTEKQFIGNKKVEIREWEISVKNNKNEPINMIILDQVPVATSEDISLEIENISNGKLTKENGEVQWNFSLDPTQEIKLNLKYAAKYAKNRNLILE
ncbi:mucoidy inhibitor MuiA family protein [Zunongwangia pacifica]|uniref:Mucoidy inhibitor MuiA family protein n=1 Tax=Zunongwangia pacifica TaxID=2911062 RepID=A0A9X1ZTH6_9FLAO|nr:mucoidy inhibitor MuiA family protein [Zunongwangia pacifica]MCL6217355.1 mucoidy inhibitor MuiA family protein [Zunongwangia pacifica]